MDELTFMILAETKCDVDFKVKTFIYPTLKLPATYARQNYKFWALNYDSFVSIADQREHCFWIHGCSLPQQKTFMVRTGTLFPIPKQIKTSLLLSSVTSFLFRKSHRVHVGTYYIFPEGIQNLAACQILIICKKMFSVHCRHPDSSVMTRMSKL